MDREVWDGTEWANKWNVSGDFAVEGSLNQAGAAVVVNFDANNNNAASRPDVPSTTTVIWFNVTAQPTNLGTFDLWVDTA